MVRNMKKTRILNIIIALVLCGSLTACANNKHKDMSYSKVPTEINDPLEPLNRVIFGFNNAVDIVLFEPVSKAYLVIVPESIRNSVQNFMRNLRAPVMVANNLLQGDIGGAGVGTARFLINSTVGIGGLFDVANSHQGLEYEQEDFGQTLAVWGLGDGFYLVLPLLGPSSLRDTAGLAVDTFADPVRILASNDQNNEWIYYTRNGIEALDGRSRLIDSIRDLRHNSLDFYAAIRSIYAQKRSDLILENDGAAYDIPDYDDEF